MPSLNVMLVAEDKGVWQAQRKNVQDCSKMFKKVQRRISGCCPSLEQYDQHEKEVELVDEEDCQRPFGQQGEQPRRNTLGFWKNVQEYERFTTQNVQKCIYKGSLAVVPLE
jgi:hypothetical protein